MIKGYKVFNPDWTCRGFQYEVGKTYEFDGTPIICEQGFHFCEKLVDCFDYYDFDDANRVAEIIAHGIVIKKDDGNKSCTDKIEIVRELSWEEVLRLVNTGDYNTGYGNTNDCNAGNYNVGIKNTGDCNSGYGNTGCFCTEEATIKMFDKPTSWTMDDWINSHAHAVLFGCPSITNVWVKVVNMTDDEKKENPNYETLGGFLKHIEVTNEDRQKWWENLPVYEKREVLNLPNFDAKKFQICTGIDVTKGE